jgi:hypothetical protein
MVSIKNDVMILVRPVRDAAYVDSIILQTSHHWISSRGATWSLWCTITGLEALLRFRKINMPPAPSLFLQRHRKVRVRSSILHRIDDCNKTEFSLNTYCSKCTNLIFHTHVCLCILPRGDHTATLFLYEYIKTQWFHSHSYSVCVSFNTTSPTLESYPPFTIMPYKGCTTAKHRLRKKKIQMFQNGNTRTWLATSVLLYSFRYFSKLPTSLKALDFWDILHLSICRIVVNL